MATVTCTLKYEDDGTLTKRYQVAFDANDIINVVTETPGLAIRAKNSGARKLFPALTHKIKKATGTLKKQVSKKNGSNQKAVYEFDPPLAKPRAKPKVEAPATATKPSELCFSVQTNKLAVFVCGYRENGKFTPDKDADGPTFPN